MSVHVLADAHAKLPVLKAMLEERHAVTAELLSTASVPRGKIVHNYALSAYYLQPMITGAMAEAIRKQPAIAALGPVSQLESYENFAARFGGSVTMRAAE